MRYLPKGARLRFTWTIRKEGSIEKESLPDSGMQVCLLRGKHVYPLQYTLDDGDICGELPDTLPEGVYGFRAVWDCSSDSETHFRGSHVFDLFALTTDANKVECNHSFMHITFIGYAEDIPYHKCSRKDKKDEHDEYERAREKHPHIGPLEPCDCSCSCNPMIPEYILLHGLQGSPGADATANLLDGWGSSTGDGITQKFLTEQHVLQQTKDAAQDTALDGLQGTVENLGSAVSDLEDTDARQDEAIDALASDIDTLIADGAVLSLSASPSVFFVGEQVSFAVTFTSTADATSLMVTSSAMQDELRGEGKTLTGSLTHTSLAAGTIQLTGQAIIRGRAKVIKTNVYAVNPIYYGAGATSMAALSNVASARRTASGRYTMAVHAGDKLWWLTPVGITITKITLSGFDVPMKAAVREEIAGVLYNIYESENTYQAGSLTFEVS